MTQAQREYREVYLRSAHWRYMRALALEDAEDRCAVCNSAKRLDVHHRTYERLGKERLTDLLVLCRDCHDIFHRNGRLEGSKTVVERRLGRAKKSNKKKKSQPTKASSSPGYSSGRGAVAIGRSNEHLHLVQQRNKQKQREAREAREGQA